MSLPPPSFELFMRGIQLALQQNSHIIPPHGEGMKLYVRPMLLGSGQQLGLYPSSQFSLLFYVSPTVSALEFICVHEMFAPCHSQSRSHDICGRLSCKTINST
jgi:hypothetical protein